MTPAQDPFYIVKEEIQESIDKLQATFHQWGETPSNTGEWVHLSKELVTSCESIEWQVDELDKTVAVAARDPAWYGLDVQELDKRKRWTKTAHTQVDTIRKTLEAGREKSSVIGSSYNGGRRELMRLPNDSASQTGTSHPYHDNEEFITSESDRQMLLIKQQDEELDELSASVQRIGGVGLTIHEELIGQEKILDELSLEMETASNRLDFVQKRVAMVMKKAGAKGQFMMIAFLLVLFIILFVLVFFT
ncbi:syntaxin-61-like [Dioscorea cayenensis subsp. rotundata]|uniref:Syntaxin-61-like n=1 Tax=Dioscorea cayennensis subsp. rotundata TaxID=55577 RepID=A0AB40AP34_DIOCR|nr:syntaxin-61-like [Dioscorea cayenensis subsp. rotundata]XP_039116509.1 syntaxin-61-like [Dioscorea cayenensis subsp. rotundata]XP_039116510.1 syntaxin-61-like [Dioscorea cayenensis subsp. rotundata]